MFEQSIDPIWRHASSGAVVYVGTADAAQSEKVLSERNISRVVNCTINDYTYPGSVEWRRCPVAMLHVPSSRSAPDAAAVAEFFAPAYAWLDAATAQGASVLIHCAAGMHRGGTVGVAWLMHARGLGAADALTAVQEARPMVSPKDIPQLWMALELLELHMQAEGRR